MKQAHKGYPYERRQVAGVLVGAGARLAAGVAEGAEVVEA